jgi:hypothetical protein
MQLSPAPKAFFTTVLRWIATTSRTCFAFVSQVGASLRSRHSRESEDSRYARETAWTIFATRCNDEQPGA